MSRGKISRQISSYNRLGIEESEVCGCYYCRSVFNLIDTPIKEWIDRGSTALCPLCGVDSVLPKAWTALADDSAHLAQLYADSFGRGTCLNPSRGVEESIYIENLFSCGKLLSVRRCHLKFDVERRDDGLYYLKNETQWGLLAGGETSIGALADAVTGEFEVLWRNYAEADDKDLTPAAQVMKHNLQQRFIVEEDFTKDKEERAPVCVTQEGIEAKIAAEYLIRLKDVLEAQGAPVAPGLENHTLCVLVLQNGFVVLGESACAHPLKYNEEVGRANARRNAMLKIWPLEGYLLKEKLSAGEAI
jgi:hypothetical protein